MNRHEQSTIPENSYNEFGSATLISTSKRIEPRRNDIELDSSLDSELNVDPLYIPILEAAKKLHQNIEEQTKYKIEAIKRETADQTNDLYNRLTEAKEEFKHLQQTLQAKSDELEAISSSKLQLENQLQSLQLLNQQQKQDIENLKTELENLTTTQNVEINSLTLKHDALITKLRSKIEQINQDYDQQLTNLQQKLTYQQQHANSEITRLHEEKNALQHHFKENIEKLTHADHSLNLANEELERSQLYIRELEYKNNAVQKELLENWIAHKDEF